MQPLSVDWRERLKTNRKGGTKGSSSASSPDPAPFSPGAGSAQVGAVADVSMTTDGKPNLELLSKGLPAGWRAMWDKNTGDIYYGNLKSRVRNSRKGWEQPWLLNIAVSAMLCQMQLFASVTEI